jgi:hypothetical protein
MKRYLFLLAIAFTAFSCTSKIDFDPVAVVAPITNSDLIISEISTAINTDVNAAGTRPHYVELYNGTAAAVDMSNYAIGYMAVTDMATLSPWAFPSPTYYFILKKTLAVGKCYVIASPQTDATAVKRDTTWGTTSTTSASAVLPLQLSGNSAIALLKKDAAGTITLSGAMYKIIDVFGSPLVARVTSTGATSARNNIIWTVAGENGDTRNRTFLRKKTVMNPTTNWAAAQGSTASDSEWLISPDKAWDYSNVGLPTP